MKTITNIPKVTRHTFHKNGKIRISFFIGLLKGINFSYIFFFTSFHDKRNYCKSNYFIHNKSKPYMKEISINSDKTKHLRSFKNITFFAGRLKCIADMNETSYIFSKFGKYIVNTYFYINFIENLTDK